MALDGQWFAGGVCYPVPLSVWRVAPLKWLGDSSGFQKMTKHLKRSTACWHWSGCRGASHAHRPASRKPACQFAPDRLSVTFKRPQEGPAVAKVCKNVPVHIWGWSLEKPPGKHDSSSHPVLSTRASSALGTLFSFWPQYSPARRGLDPGQARRG